MCTDIIRNTATPFISHSWPCCILLEDMGTHVKADCKLVFISQPPLYTFHPHISLIPALTQDTQLIPAVDLRFIPIPPIRIVSTMLLSQLITPSRSSAPPTITNTTTDTTNSLSFDLLKQFGFITIDQSRNILLLDHADPRVADFRLAGM